MKSVFETLPLEATPDGIRVVTILPGSEQIRCEMKVVSLRDSAQGKADPDLLNLRQRDNSTLTKSPGNLSVEDKQLLSSPERRHFRFSWGDFAALSYTWGPPVFTSTIFINDIEMHVTQNLAIALQALRTRGNYHSRFHIWVDALCINQADSEERSREVALMPRLYRAAWSVVGWLGPEEENSSKALSLLRALACYHGRHNDCLSLKDILRNYPNYFQTGEGSWLALNRLTLRPYWERLWVIQELALGGRRILIFCGETEIGWVQMCLGFEVIHRYLWAEKNELVDGDRRAVSSSDSKGWEKSGPLHHIYKDLWPLTRREGNSEQSIQLSRLLEIANFANCADPRDKVYGILGIMPKRLASRLTPDYTLDTGPLFTTVAKTLIAVFGDLELLRDANCWGESSAPTWAPDWAWTGRFRDARPAAEVNSDVTKLPIDGSLRAETGYTADKGILFTGVRYEGQYLICHAILFDSVDGLGPQPCSSTAYVSGTMVQPQYNKTAYGSREQTIMALSRALYADRSRCSPNSKALIHLPTSLDTALRVFKRMGWAGFVADEFYYSKWTCWVDHNAALRIDSIPLGEYFTSSPPADADFFEYWAAYQDFQRTMLGRRFAITTNGCFAWVPHHRDGPLENHTRPGDKLAVIPGCSTPILLRAYGDGFQVVGEAYVHGFMDGEIAQLLQAGEYEIQEIRLR